MDKDCLKRYRRNKREMAFIDRSLERLYDQLENVPVVQGKVSKSADDFPYTPQRVTVQMAEPKQASAIEARIREREARMMGLENDMRKAENEIAALPDGIEKEILQAVYLDGKTQQEVGEMIGYTKGRISQIISKTVKD